MEHTLPQQEPHENYGPPFMATVGFLANWSFKRDCSRFYAFKLLPDLGYTVIILPLMLDPLYLGPPPHLTIVSQKTGTRSFNRAPSASHTSEVLVD